jgi:hypothetical protein
MVHGAGFMALGSGLGDYGAVPVGFRVQGSGCRVQGAGFRILVL